MSTKIQGQPDIPDSRNKEDFVGFFNVRKIRIRHE